MDFIAVDVEAPRSTTIPGPPLQAVCWGTRGSVPSPGPGTACFGGNTSCLEVRTADGHGMVFDAGTGIRALGHRLATAAGPLRTELFLTHFHWDHIQGIPFFAPLYDPRSYIRVHAMPQNGSEIQELFARQMSPIYFPVPFEALSARLDFVNTNGKMWMEHGAEVAALPVCHPGDTCGYRIRAGGATVVYIPDNELAGPLYTDTPAEYGRLVEFVRNADVLLHDAMYTEDEYVHRRGWGHSTYSQAIALAEAAGVRRLLFFHHAPDRTDAELSGLLGAQRAELRRRASPLEIGMAAEGEEIFARQ